MSPSFIVVDLQKRQHSVWIDPFTTMPAVKDFNQTRQKVRKLSADYLLGMAAETLLD